MFFSLSRAWTALLGTICLVALLVPIEVASQSQAQLESHLLTRWAAIEETALNYITNEVESGDVKEQGRARPSTNCAVDDPCVHMSSVIDLLLGIEQAVASVISVTVRLEEMMYATEEISREKLDDFFDDLEWVLDELFEDLMAGFAARDGVSNLEEKLASASDLGAWATEAINTFGNSYGIPDATRNRYVGELYPYITYLVLKFGEISEQHPRLLKALLVDIVRRDRELDEFRTTHSSEQASQPTSVAVSDNTGLGLPAKVGQYAVQLYHSVRKFIEDLLSGAFEAFHATAKSLASDITTFAKDVHRATTAFWDGDQGLAESATDIAESLGGIVKHNLNVETLLAIVVPILNPVFVVLPGPVRRTILKPVINTMVARFGGRAARWLVCDMGGRIGRESTDLLSSMMQDDEEAPSLSNGCHDYCGCEAAGTCQVTNRSFLELLSRVRSVESHFPHHCICS